MQCFQQEIAHFLHLSTLLPWRLTGDSKVVGDSKVAGESKVVSQLAIS